MTPQRIKLLEGEEYGDRSTFRPIVPKNLTTVADEQLAFWRRSLAEVKCSIEAQLSDPAPRTRGRDGIVRRMTEDEHGRWRHAAVKTLRFIQVDVARIKQEQRERLLRRPRKAKTPKPASISLLPALRGLATALATWQEAPAEVRAAADELLRVVTVQKEREDEQRRPQPD